MGVGSSARRMVNMDGPVAKFVKEQIPKEKVVIFSKSYCPYCKMAKEAAVLTGPGFGEGHVCSCPERQTAKAGKFKASEKKEGSSLSKLGKWVSLKVFDQLSQTYYAIELDLREDGEEIQDVLKEITGARSVPRVFIKGNFVGGGSDVKSLHEKGELVKLLA